MFGNRAHRSAGVALSDPVALQTGLVPDVTAIQFSPDGTIIATAGNADQTDDSSVRLWSAQTSQQLEILPAVGAPIASRRLHLPTLRVHKG